MSRAATAELGITTSSFLVVRRVGALEAPLLRVTPIADRDPVAVAEGAAVADGE
ncbi:MAG: hypothetical protein R2862_08935 [Thermoanaerobaculia bacterium]